MPAYSNLSRGLNLWGFSAGVNMQPGEALNAQDVLPRGDGAIFKHWGWRRINATALGARIIAHKGFTYKGKNIDTGANTNRPGNLGIADDAPAGPPPGGTAFTRRQEFYSSAVALTDTECRFWNPATETLDLPVLHYPIGGAPAAWLPTGVTIDVDPKPTLLVLQNNVYIFGWASHNLRYDPTDRVLYVAGWDSVPANAGHTGVGAGGALVANAVYRYRLAWIDLFTGEEGELSAEYAQTTTVANRTITLDNFAAYVGARHFWYHLGYGAAEVTNADIGLVVYRTEADRQTYHFLALVYPDLGAASVVDNGLATDASLQGDVRDYQDLPRLNFATEWRSQIYGVSWRAGDSPTGVQAPSRVYYNDFRKEKSFIERWDVRDYRELPLQDGEVITAVAKTNQAMVVLTNLNAYGMDAVPNATTGSVQLSLVPLQWTVGCVGPKAWCYVGGYLYFLSDRGPYRWAPGSPEPEWIGRNLVPMFIDPETGLCQLNFEGKLESEVFYDQDADVVRFVFPCGTSLTPNRHLMYWLRSDQPDYGWFFHSTEAQALDWSAVYEGLVGGLPVTPLDTANRLVWSDPNGYLYAFEPASRRGGLPAGVPASGVGQAGSGVNLIVTTGGLYVTGNGMARLRLEVVYANGVVDVRTVQSNTAANIVPVPQLTADPTGATWYVAGIPAYWTSWIDHAGEPSSHKTLRHLWLGYNRETLLGDQVIDLVVSTSDDWPAAVSRTRTAALNVHRAQVMCSLTGRYFTYEFANTRPDEPFMISHFEPELQTLTGRRR